MPFTVNIYPSASVLHKMHLQSVPVHLQESSIFKVTTQLPFPPQLYRGSFYFEGGFSQPSAWTEKKSTEGSA